jgi:hypothetical protein
MNAVECALKRDHQVEGEFTGWISSLERVLMKKDRFLAGPVAKKVHAVKVAEEVVVARDVPSPVAEPVVSAVAQPPVPVKRVEVHQPANSLFAEKLQAVLGPQK